MRDVNYGWLIRYAHANGASFFFLCVYLHIARGLYYGSFNKPRVELWAIGVTIFIVLLATAFLGYFLSPKWFVSSNLLGPPPQSGGPPPQSGGGLIGPKVVQKKRFPKLQLGARCFQCFHGPKAQPRGPPSPAPPTSWVGRPATHGLGPCYAWAGPGGGIFSCIKF